MAPLPRPTITVDAAAVAEELGLAIDEFRRLMEAGRIRTLSERGTGPEHGLYRLSFWYRKRRFRIVTDHEGRVFSNG